MILVGGAITILKNLEKYESQWEGWHPILWKTNNVFSHIHMISIWCWITCRIRSGSPQLPRFQRWKWRAPLLVIAVSPLLLRRQETIRNLCESSCPTLSDFSDPNPWNFSTCGCASACCAQGCFLIKLYAVLGATKVWWAARSLMRWQERQWQSMN